MTDYPLRMALIKALRRVNALGVRVPVRGPFCGIKTVGHFTRVIESLIRDLYRGNIDQGEFTDAMVDLITDQLTRAWNEGMRANELDPVEDMEPEWEQKRDDLILSEFDYVDQFAADVVTARENEAGWYQLTSRAQIWGNRYNDVVNQAVLITKEQRLEWELGATEQHCQTCFALNGIVAFSSEWDLAGVHPQQPPNDVLECGGWHCDCRFKPTNKRRTRNAFDAIMGALGK